MVRAAPLNVKGALEIGDAALTFLASDPPRLVRFLQVTGTTPEAIRNSADSRETLAAVLNYLLEDESLLLVFSSETGTPPERVGPAAALLTGGGDAWQ